MTISSHWPTISPSSPETTPPEGGAAHPAREHHSAPFILDPTMRRGCVFKGQINLFTVVFSTPPKERSCASNSARGAVCRSRHSMRCMGNSLFSTPPKGRGCASDRSQCFALADEIIILASDFHGLYPSYRGDRSSFFRNLSGIALTIVGDQDRG